MVQEKLSIQKIQMVISLILHEVLWLAEVFFNIFYKEYCLHCISYGIVEHQQQDISKYFVLATYVLLKPSRAYTLCTRQMVGLSSL